MKSYIWSLPTRVFHWMLVLFVLLAWGTSEFENLLDYHAAIGYDIGVLILFRIIWGWIGPRYSRFSDWPLSFRETLAFVTHIHHPKKTYAGHNPAASFVMLAIIGVTFLLSLTGLLTYGVQEGKGLFAFLNDTFFKEMELFESLHEGLATILFFLVAAHLAGVISDHMMHPENGTLASIFKGYKKINTPSVRLNFTQKVFAAIMLVAALLVTLLALSPQSPLSLSIHQATDYTQEHPLFVAECASCHTLYPPQLLPKKSWTMLMSNLEDHFGDDASLEEEDRISILQYLQQNAAENSTQEAAVNILHSFPNKDIIAVTQTPYWQKRHKEIEKAYFQSPKVKSKANCKACHGDVEQGLIEDANISLPRLEG